MHSILKWDQQLFKLINNDWQNPFFDAVLPFFRIAEFWVPLYVFLLLFGLINYKKNGWKWIIFAVATSVLTDYISSDIIKPNIIRLRPCNDPAIFDWVRVLVAYRPQSSSFTSSHAANHFGLAMFLFLTLKDQFGKKTIAFFVWAGIICYSQIYVGVHYPLDILGGTVVGCLAGYLTGTIFNKKIGLRDN